MLRPSSLKFVLSPFRFFALFALLLGCDNGIDTVDVDAPLIAVPTGFPAQTFPADNIPTAERIALGKKLFFDPILSSDMTVSCASCHRPDVAFADNARVSPGVAGRVGTRNAPSLINVGYYPYFMREGGVPTLEMQVLAPVQEHNEMDMNILDVVERLKADEEYKRMSQVAYEREIDAWVVTRAIASYERTLVTRMPNAKRQMPNQECRMPDAECRTNDRIGKGRTLFYSERTNCSTCHGGFLFTDHSFQNNGLYNVYSDRGRGRLTGNNEDDALFKVPSLWNVSVTAPYMHDGSMQTLQQVVAHYNEGGAMHPHKSERIRPLHLTEEEQTDLVAFLTSLAGY